MSKTIDITFDAKGNPRIETSGFQGGECLQATLAVERALGSKVSDTKKAEHNQMPQAGTRLKAGR